jgi:hypothetical protein
MDREAIKDCYRALAKVQNGLGALPYRVATPLIAELDGMRDMLAEELPGGFVGFCEMCEGVIAEDDGFAADEDGCHICQECCDQALEPAHD